MESILKYAPLWGKWKVDSLLEVGNLGKIYKIKTEENGDTLFAAVRLISISWDEIKKISPQYESITDIESETNMKGIATELGKRFQFMKTISINKNILKYEDIVIYSHKERMSYDILVKMEYLPNLEQNMNKQKLTMPDVVKLGIDICNAFEEFRKHNIIHKKIKPSNIFFDGLNYKIGDFGFVRPFKDFIHENKKEMYTYVAPEVYKNKKYNLTIDTYSLGLIMYQLLNDNKIIFQDDTDNSTSLLEATSVRMDESSLPIPKNSIALLNIIILKACAYNPEDRFDSPSEFKSELEQLLEHHSNLLNSESQAVPQDLEEFDTFYDEEIFSDGFVFEGIESIDKIDSITGDTYDEIPLTVDSKNTNTIENIFIDGLGTSQFVPKSTAPENSHNSKDSDINKDLESIFTEDFSFENTQNDERKHDNISINNFVIDENMQPKSPENQDNVFMDDFDFDEPIKAIEPKPPENQDNVFMDDFDFDEPIKAIEPKSPKNQDNVFMDDFDFDEPIKAIEPKSPENQDNVFMDDFDFDEPIKAIEPKSPENQDNVFMNDFDFDEPIKAIEPKSPKNQDNASKNDINLKDTTRTPKTNPTRQITPISGSAVDETPKSKKKNSVNIADDAMFAGFDFGAPSKEKKKEKNLGLFKKAKKSKNNKNQEQLDPNYNLGGLDLGNVVKSDSSVGDFPTDEFDQLKEPDKNSYVNEIDFDRKRKFNIDSSKDNFNYQEEMDDSFENLKEQNKKNMNKKRNKKPPKTKKKSKTGLLVFVLILLLAIGFFVADYLKFLPFGIVDNVMSLISSEPNIPPVVPDVPVTPPTSKPNDTTQSKYIFNNTDEDIESALKKITSPEKVITLHINECGIQDLSILSEFVNLETLYLDSNVIGSLNSLEKLINLKELDLSHNSITDISQLSSLTNLQSLNLSSNLIADIAPLDNLKQLTSLQLENNKIVSLEPITNLTMLEILMLSSNQVEDISFLKNLTNLNTLELNSNSITNIENLSSLVELTTISLIKNTIEDISALSSLPNLSVLNLTENQVNNLQPLSNLTNLIELHLNSNLVTDISPLVNLNKLELLYLSINEIADINVISNLVQLKKLSIGKIGIDNISAISNLTNLEYLDLGGNQISDISPISDLTKLTTLSISGNIVSILSPLESLVDLDSLYLFNNQIEDVVVIGTLKKLNILNLSGNPIQDITPLRELKELTELKIKTNTISDFSPIADIPKLKKLTVSVDITDAQLSSVTEALSDLEIKKE